MMKKLAASVLSLSLLLSGSAVYAHDDDHDKSAEEWLEKALERVKDPEAKEALKRALEQQKKESKVKTALQIVKADKEALSITFSGNDSAKSVTLPLLLPTVGKYGSTITWTSNRTDIITNDGKIVARPYQAGDVQVTLQAAISKNNAKETKTFKVTVKAQLTDAQRVALDQASLSIGFSGKDNAGSVTSKLHLPVVGENGSSITWSSSAPSVISHDGKIVNRPAGGQGDAAVTLTAVIRSNNEAVTKTFTVVVKERYTDAQRVAADKAALSIGYTSGDDANRVTSSLKLSDSGANGSKITWISSNTDIIANNGKLVGRPAAGQGDVTVTMFAIISSKAITDVKSFTLVVKQQWNETEKVAADKAALSIGFNNNDTAGSVTGKLTLPTTGVYGSAISWTSSSPAVIAVNGAVTRPAAGQGDVSVTLTATIKSGSVTDVKQFTVVVKQQWSDAQKVAADKAALSIGYSGSDNAGSVTSNVKLPALGDNGSTIIWFSAKPQLVTEKGVVSRPAKGSGDQSVVLTAVIINNLAVDWKEFVLLVKQQP
ncbi:immunoglobulin-like domain-containing protein [Paenibacillus thermotolerans]|uniref:immunoglobulin-like domain-containing protein n=1 Tax=Paenibacillus thermotolerans TaxID=3027807 RepID=UPI002367E16A|nr:MULTISPECIES: immunoglobulin-like domain-containing protein [unclassified Paenibacillus]